MNTLPASQLKPGLVVREDAPHMHRQWPELAKFRRVESITVDGGWYKIKFEGDGEFTSVTSRPTSTFEVDDSALIAPVVERVKAEILADIADGTMPADVGSFSELHNFVDANEYGGLCDGDGCPAGFEFPDDDGTGERPEASYERMINNVNAMQDAVDAWLKAGRP